MSENKTNNQTINTNLNGNNKPVQKNRNGFAIASLVLGILSIVLSCLWFISIPCGILAIIFGGLGMKSEKRGLAIAGIVTGIIGTIALIIILVASLGVYIFNSATEIVALIS